AREPQIAWAVSGGAGTPWAARGSANATTAQPARNRRTADGAMMALGEWLGVPPNLPAGADRGRLDRRTVWEHVSRNFPLPSLEWCTLARPSSLACLP